MSSCDGLSEASRARRSLYQITKNSTAVPLYPFFVKEGVIFLNQNFDRISTRVSIYKIKTDYVP